MSQLCRFFVVVRQIRNVAKHENMNTTNIENLKALPIADYLHHIGINVPQRGNICATWRGDSNPSVSINTTKNVWYDHGTGEGGSVLDLVMRVENCDFNEACRKVEDFSFNRPYIPITPKVEPKESGIVLDDIKELSHPALLRYLDERCIPIEIASMYCKQVHYHTKNNPDAKYFAIGFENNEGGWELRSPFFKGATKKAATYFNNFSPTLVIFEGFMDFLSYLAMPEGIIPKVADANYLILNSVAQAQNAVNDYQRMEEWGEQHGFHGKPFYKVHYAMDNDPAGIDATFRMANIGGVVGNAGYEDLRDKMVTYSGYLTVEKINDLNDLLIAVKTIEKKKGGVGYGC